MTVKTNDPRPPYLQIADDLREAIRSGRYEPGHRLPAGRELAKQYGVALMTVQRALNTLAADGLIEQYQGRGVFVRSGDGKPGPHGAADLRTLANQLVTAQDDIRRLDERLAALERSL